MGQRVAARQSIVQPPLVLGIMPSLDFGQGQSFTSMLAAALCFFDRETSLLTPGCQWYQWCSRNVGGPWS